MYQLTPQVVIQTEVFYESAGYTQPLFNLRNYEDGTAMIIQENTSIIYTDLYEFRQLLDVPVKDLMRLPLFNNDAVNKSFKL
jgi:hypothetical protein